MSLLRKNSLPAERARGCVWAQRFHSQTDVEKNGGSVTGAPTFDVTTGATMDGAADYITYAVQGNEFNSADISIVAEFYPDFAYDEDANSVIFSSTGDDYQVRKAANGASNVLRIYLGGVLVAEIASATYSPHWVVGGRNVLVVSGTTGDTSAWLNGSSILSNDATAWTPKANTTVTIGSDIGGGKLFDGSISSFKIFNQILTADEAIDYYNNTTFTWRDRMLIDLPMLAADDDPGVKTLNRGRGGSANDAASGAGAAAPTKLTHSRGYSLDGGDYFNVATSGMDIDTADFTFFIRAALGTAANTTKYYCTTAANGISVLYNSAVGNLFAYSGSDGACSYSWTPDNASHTIIFTRVSGIDYLYLDGQLVDTDATASGSVASSNNWYLGATSSPTADWDGEIYQAGMSDTLGLTETQAADCHLQMMKGVNVL